MIDPRFRIPISIIMTCVWIIANGVLFKMTILPGSELRYLLLPFFLWLVIFIIGFRFVLTAFNFKSAAKSMQFLTACMLNLNIPELVIQDGKAQLGEENDNQFTRLGGPGKLQIQIGSAAVSEDCRGIIRVLGPGRHSISHYEIMKECTHLDERFQPIAILSARTKDGIEVSAKDIRFRFRISSNATGDGGERHGPESVYRFSDEGLTAIVYGRAQTDSRNRTWEEDIRNFVEATILEFIHRHQVDYLTAPGSQGTDPRAELYQEFLSHEGKKKFSELGAELIWMDIGHFETPEENVAKYRVATWQAKWQGAEKVMRAFAEAQDIGRLEAQAEVLKKILEGLEAMGPPRKETGDMRPMYLARIAQIMDTLRETV